MAEVGFCMENLSEQANESVSRLTTELHKAKYERDAVLASHDQYAIDLLLGAFIYNRRRSTFVKDLDGNNPSADNVLGSDNHPATALT